MHSCPKEKQLALYIEGKLTAPEARKMSQHLAECQECSHALADVVGLQDLEADGLLPEVTPEETNRAFQALQKLINRQTDSKTLKPTKDSRSSRLNDFLGSVIAAAGLTKMQGSFDEFTPEPGLGEKNENIFGIPVRNDPIISFELSQDNDATDIELNQEPETVNNNIYAKVEPAPTVVGIAGVDGQSTFVKQGYEDTCAIRSQELILRDFGVNVSENVLRDEAISNQWYIPGSGTHPNHIGNLLELHGVEVNRYEKANIFTLTSELSKGHRVIIGVDSGELWNKGLEEEQEDRLVGERADHALIVSGIDTSDPNNVKVILTDPGSGDIAKEYPMEQFIDAWKDSNFFMVSTVEPAPLAFNPEMANFNYALGHLSEIGNLSYGNFQELFAPCIELELADSLLNDQAELLSQYVHEGEFFAEHPTWTTDEAIPSDYLESSAIAIENIFDFSEDDASANHDHYFPQDNHDLDDSDDF